MMGGGDGGVGSLQRVTSINKDEEKKMDFKSLGVSYGVQEDRERTETRSLVERF